MVVYNKQGSPDKFQSIIQAIILLILTLVFIKSSPWVNYSIKAVKNQCGALYIINSARNCISSTRSVVYHQAAERYTLARDEIQGRIAPLMIYTLLRAVMIYQAYGNPQSSSSSLRGTPTAAWITKKDTEKLDSHSVEWGILARHTLASRLRLS